MKNLKGISDKSAERICRALERKVPPLGHDVILLENLILTHCNPSVVEGRCGDGPWTYWLAWEGKPSDGTFNFICAMFNLLMQDEQVLERITKALTQNR